VHHDGGRRNAGQREARGATEAEAVGRLAELVEERSRTVKPAADLALAP
jgi:hypothetical protein